MIFKDDLEEIIGARPEGARVSESINDMPEDEELIIPPTEEDSSGRAI